MNEHSRETIAVQLADGVADLTRRHSELLDRLKHLREGLQRTAPTAGHQPPPGRLLEPPPPARRLISIPSGPSVPSRIVNRTAPPPTVVETSALGASSSLAPSSERSSAPPIDSGAIRTEAFQAQGGSAQMHPLTKRDYDYFSELDDLLARLSVAAAPEKQGPPLDREGPRAN